jgi:hypothetical protein
MKEHAMFGLNLIKTSAVAAVLAVAGWAGAASATTVTTSDVGTSWSVDMTCTTNANCAGVSSEVTYTLVSVDTSNPNQVVWNMSMTIANTSSQFVTGTSSSTGYLTAVGFDTDPNATMSNFTNVAGGTTWGGGPGSIPSTTTELCVWDGANCSASGNHAMTYGTSDQVTFSLTTLGSGTSLTFDGEAVKFAGVGPRKASYEFGTPAPVPLPAAGLLLLGGLGALGAAKRRRRHAA